MAAAASGATLPTSVNQLTVTRTQFGGGPRGRPRRPVSHAAACPGSTPAGRPHPCGLHGPHDGDGADFGFDALTVSDWALREGIVLDAIGRHDLADWRADQRAIRRSSVLNLCRRCSWDERHGRQVARLALSLFDQLEASTGLGHADRELLEYGAFLHDIGEHVSVEATTSTRPT